MFMQCLLASQCLGTNLQSENNYYHNVEGYKHSKYTLVVKLLQKIIVFQQLYYVREEIEERNFNYEVVKNFN